MPLTIVRKVSVTGGTVLRAANNLGDVASAATARTNLGVLSVAEVAARTSGSAPRGGIVSAGTSAVGTTQDNAGLAFGTGDLSIGAWVRLADWTPAANSRLVHKLASNLGIVVYTLSTGMLRFQFGTGAGTTQVDSTVANGIADGAWAHIAIALDRDGNAVFYVNGAQLGAPVSIAASAAQTFTSTAALNWGSDGAGTNITGTLGETFIISGLLTATSVADIYKAGSIAPFAASFTFYQWVDFGQGYGPIVKDRSGQNQPALLGTSGLTHAVPRHPPGVPPRAARAAVNFDGAAGARISAALGAQDPGSGDAGFYLDAANLFSDVSGTTRTLAGLSSSIAAVTQPRSLLLQYNTSGVRLILFGATTSDYRLLNSPTLATLLADKRAVFHPRRSSSGMKLYLGLDGDWMDATHLFAESTGGASTPAWTAPIAGTYLVGAYTDSGTSSALALHDFRLANVALTEAQLRTEYERGEPGPEWRGATKASLVTGDNSTFASDTGFWDKNAVNIAAGKATFTTGGASYIRRIGSLAVGKRYRVIFTISNYVAAMDVGDNVSTYNTYSANGTYTLEFTATGVNLTFRYGQCDLDDVTLEPIGYTARLRTATAAGLTALNGAKSATNDSADFLLSSTGVTTSPDGRRQTIRATTTTIGNEQLFGASVIDTTKNWRIRSWSVVSSGTPTVSLGSASGGVQYVSGAVLSAAQNEIALLTRVPASANLWCNANSTATLKHTVVLELVD